MGGGLSRGVREEIRYHEVSTTLLGFIDILKNAHIKMKAYKAEG